MGVYQPPLYGDFFAFSGYGYIASFFDLGQDLSLAALEASGRAFCAKDWEQILREHPDERGRKYLPAYCFKAAYVVTLLTDGFGFPMTTRRIVTPNRVQGSEVGWVLGSVVYELGGGAD
jgi:apyrase